ncbi:MAG: lanthionine synthetase C family protein [Acidobacteriota bacterium]
MTSLSASRTRTTPTPATWTPVLEGDLAVRANVALGDLADALLSEPTLRPDDESLADGNAGRALTLAYLSAARPGLVAGDAVATRLERSVVALAETPMSASLYCGFVGVAWARDHVMSQLAHRVSGLDDIPDPGEVVDLALAEHLSRETWPHHHDLVEGLVGFGAHALSRLPRESAFSCLRSMLGHLETLAVEHGDGLAWFTSNDLVPSEHAVANGGTYCVGVAHGVAGIAALLSALVRADIERDRALVLLDGAVSWLLARKLEDDADAVFPYDMGDGRDELPARLAWCHGELGISVVLLQAARATGRQDWELEARVIARRAAARTRESSGVEDAALCHGASGIGHVFNRLWHATGDDVMADAARRWFELALDMQHPGTGVAGYRAWDRGDDGRLAWHDDSGFLNGASGIALALLAATTSIAPAWDAILLLSSPCAEATS